MATTRQKLLGQFFTPEEVAANLIDWAVEGESDRVLDPSCGDGEFLRQLTGAVGIELCPENAARAREAAPDAEVVEADFFEWAAACHATFDAAVGNPPFIRYQQFNGSTREQALELSKRIGVELNGLTSSWAPFLAVSASLLEPGGRMAFVVPAEIGHATYAAPLIEGLCNTFDRILIVAVREKLFPELSQDAWLLFAAGKGGKTDTIDFATVDRFSPDFNPDGTHRAICMQTWRKMGGRLRRFLIPPAALETYLKMTEKTTVTRLGDIADVTIGYVSGDNDFFHFDRAAARMYDIPEDCLRPTIRRGEQLSTDYVENDLIQHWLDAGEEILVLDLSRTEELPESVRDYLSSTRAEEARKRYKCRVRDPWYVIPGVDQVPSAFVTCMSGCESRLSINQAGAVCTNSVLAVTLDESVARTELLAGWRHPLARLSQELEGHPLGGGMLKLEPGEARRVHIPLESFRTTTSEDEMLAEATELMRTWRHYGPDADRG